MKPYEKYKPSGVEWIGDIPENWKVKRLKYLFHIYNGATPKSDNEDFWNGEIVWVTPADYSTEMQYLSDSRSKITFEGLMSCAAKVAPVGSVIISNRAPIGLVAIASVPLCTNQGCKSLVAKTNVDARYFYYFLSTQAQVLNALGKGTTFLELSSSQLGAFMLPLPDIEMQSDIADYLDREVLKINAAIMVKEKLIDLLKEKRTAIISHAVTKGLDPNAKMKPSGVEWIGDIPEGWKVTRIKMLTPVKRGASPRPIDDEIYFDENGRYSWVRISDVTASGMYLNKAGDKLSDLGVQCSVKLSKGELFVSICASVGKPCIANIDCCIHDGFVYFPKIGQHLINYLYYIFEAGLCYGGLGKLGTQLNLNTDTIGNIYIPIPEYPIQIAEYLNSKTAQIDVAIEKTKQSIEKLKEYRTALISACITGKIDVREG